LQQHSHYQTQSWGLPGVVDLFSILKIEKIQKAQIFHYNSCLNIHLKSNKINKRSKDRFQKTVQKKPTHSAKPEFNPVTINGFCIGKKYHKDLKRLNMRTEVL
jgi:hypothetical protein